MSDRISLALVENSCLSLPDVSVFYGKYHNADGDFVHLNLQQNGDLLLELAIRIKVEEDGRLWSHAWILKLERLLPLSILSSGGSIEEFDKKINQFLLSQETDQKRIDSLNSLFNSQAYWLSPNWLTYYPYYWVFDPPPYSSSSEGDEKDAKASSSSSRESFVSHLDEPNELEETQQPQNQKSPLPLFCRGGFRTPPRSRDSSPKRNPAKNESSFQ